MRTSCYLMSKTFDPWMRGVAALPGRFASSRQLFPKDNPLIERERETFGEVTQALEKIHEDRYTGHEHLSGVLHRSPEQLDSLIKGITGRRVKRSDDCG